MAEIAVKAKVDIDVDADQGLVKFCVQNEGEVLAAFRFTPEQALWVGQTLLTEAHAAKAETPNQGGSDGC